MKRLLGAAALVCFGAFSLFAQSAGVMPIPEQQFFDANGLPLSGGYIYTCVAGTSCPGNPLASYTDASGTVANPNPVVLDSGGRASIWLGSSAYKIVAENSLGTVEWTADNVTIPGLSLLSGTGTLSALTVTGNATVGGTFGVTGAATFSSTVSTGALTASSLAVTGNETVGGTLGVTGATTVTNLSATGTLGVTGASTLAALTAGATTLSSLNIGAQTLTEFVNSLISGGGSPSALDGTVAVSDISIVNEPNVGVWVVFTFGTVSGTRVRIALGSGNVGDQTSIPLPTGFSTSNLYLTAGLGVVNTGASGNNITNVDVSVSGDLVTAKASDYSGHTYTPTANWFGFCWETGY